MGRRLRVRHDRAAMARRALVEGGYLDKKTTSLQGLKLVGEPSLNVETASIEQIGRAVGDESDVAAKEYRAIVASLLADLVYLAWRDKLKIPSGFLSQAAAEAHEILTEENPGVRPDTGLLG
jgi:hypothetical protein